MLWLILITPILGFLIYHHFHKKLNYWRNLGIPQTNPVIFFGNGLDVILQRKSMPEMVLDMYNAFPNERVFGAFQMSAPAFTIKDPELIKQVMVKDFDSFTDHVEMGDPSIEPLWSSNLLMLKAQKWRNMRTKMSPAFTGSKMRIIFHWIVEIAEKYTEYFDRTVQDDGDQQPTSIKIKDTCLRYANDVIANTTFGVNVNSLEDRTNEFYVNGNELIAFNSISKGWRLIGHMMFPKLFAALRIRLLDENASRFFTNLVSENIRTRLEEGIKRPDMIQLLLEARKMEENDENNETEHISDIDITAQALIFFFAGFDSVSTQLAFMAYELTVNREIQDRLYAEIRETDASLSADGRITYETLIGMKYLDAVVSETLRLWPNGPILERICTKPYTFETLHPPVHLEKGAQVWIPVLGVHRDEANFDKPNQFDPERFIDERKEKINSGTYFPFGNGPRICIGSRFALVEMKAFFYCLVKKFELVPIEGTELKLDKKMFSTAMHEDVKIGLKRRQI